MKRTCLAALLGLLFACAPGTPPEPAPAAAPSPAPAIDAALPSQNPPETAGGPAPVALTDQADSSALSALVAADSAADVELIERLAEVRPASQDSGVEEVDRATPGGANAAATPDVTYDIDVSTYGNHARVQFYLDFFQGAARDRFAIWLARMPRYEPMIRETLREAGVPEDMVYLALIESGYSNTAVSRSRATGMWQFMKGTAKLYGLRIDGWVDERRDPFLATRAAAHHLADLRDRFGSMYLAAAAYNAGAGKVGRGLKRIGDDEDEDAESADAAFFRLYDTRFLRRETKDYVPKLIAAALIAKQPEKFGFPRLEGIEPLSVDSLVVPDATGLDVVARLADTTVMALRELNPQYLRLVTPPHETAVIRLPPRTGSLVEARYAALPASERVNFVEHTVARGQTIARIARMYDVSTKLIGDANPGVKLTRLHSGTRLVIPVGEVPASAEALASGEQPRVAPASGAESAFRHRVRNGESLWTISQEYGISVSELRSLNGLASNEALKSGQVLRLARPVGRADPTPSGDRSSRSATNGAQTHLVRPGETLNWIAGHYGVTLSALRAANGMTTRSVLKSGQRLTIPK